MNLIFLGAPGAGKGTQANKIAKLFNLNQISTGDLLRNEMKLQSKPGKDIESIINDGELVPDEIVNFLINKVISTPNNFKGIIFDGYPRNLSQIKILEGLMKKLNQKISAVFSLSVKKNIVTKRIIGRVTCMNCQRTFNEFFNPPNKKNHLCDEKYLKKRNDDNLTTILNRFETYNVKTQPVLDHYKKKNFFYKIDGNKEIDEIYNKIKGILKNLRD